MASTGWNRFPLHDYPGGAANSTGAISTDIASQVMGWRSYTSSSATSGTSYGARVQHYVQGAAGAGAALRAYALVKGVGAANLYGLEASAEVMSTASSDVTGLAAGVKAGMILNLNSSGNDAALDLSYTVATGKTAHATKSAFIRASNGGAGTGCVNLLSLPAAGLKNAGTVFVARHADCAATHAIRMVDAAGAVFYIMVSTDTPED
jgi:hypothetical protein